MLDGVKKLTPRERLAEAINERMAEIPVNLTDLAAKSGTSAITVRRLRTATGYNLRPDTMRKIASALGWTPMSCEDILKGHGPTLKAGPSHAEQILLLGAIDATGLSPEERQHVQSIVDDIKKLKG
jgi:DNA-binding Xre family transcriptional regulator